MSTSQDGSPTLL